jgi:hypothetical protein
MVRISLFYYHSDYISAEDCGLFGQTMEEECPGAVRPTVTSVEPPRGVVGLEYGVTIKGTGFAAGASVSAGSGITVSSVVVGSSTEILATFTIASNAQAGNHQVVVTVAGQSSTDNVNFFVQIPTRVTLESMSGVTTCDPTHCTINGQPNKCGAYRDLVYQVVDQSGNPVQAEGTVTETITEWSSGAPLPPDSQATDENGRFADLVGIAGADSNCPSNGSGFDRRQKFAAQFGETTFNLTTTNRLQVQKSSGQYTITITTTQQ